MKGKKEVWRNWNYACTSAKWAIHVNIIHQLNKQTHQRNHKNMRVSVEWKRNWRI